MLPVLMVTHDPDDRDAAAGRVVAIDGGKAVDDNPPSEEGRDRPMQRV